MVNHRKRKFGKSKYGYGFTRIFRGLVDLFYLSVSTEYYKRPPINKIIAKNIFNVTSISGLREINPINKFPKITKLSKDLLDGKS